MKQDEIYKRREKIVEISEKPHRVFEILKELRDKGFEVSESTVKSDLKYLMENNLIRLARNDEIKKYRKNTKYESEETKIDKRNRYYIKNTSEKANFKNKFIKQINDDYNSNKKIEYGEMVMRLEILIAREGTISLEINDELRFNLLIKLLKIAHEQISNFEYDLNLSKSLFKDDKNLIAILNGWKTKYFYLELLRYIYGLLGKNNLDQFSKNDGEFNLDLKINLNIENEDFIEGKEILEKHILEKINIITLNFEKIIGEKINNKFLEFLESNLIRLSPLYTTSYNEKLTEIKYEDMKNYIEEYNKNLQNKMKEIENQLMDLEKEDKKFINKLKKIDHKEERDKLNNEILKLSKKQIDEDNFNRLFEYIFLDKDIFMIDLKLLTILAPSKLCNVLKNMFENKKLTLNYFDPSFIKSIIDFVDDVKYSNNDFNLLLILYNPLYTVYDLFIIERNSKEELPIFNENLNKTIEENCLLYLNEKLSEFQKQEYASLVRLIKIILNIK
jgi:DNA-binding transcriptional ArsR family regulator